MQQTVAGGVAEEGGGVGEDGGAGAEGVHGRSDGGGDAVLGEARGVGAAGAHERGERVEAVHVQALLRRELRRRRDEHRRRAHRNVLSQRGCGGSIGDEKGKEKERGNGVQANGWP